MQDKVIIDRHWYLTEDGSQVVGWADPRGAFLHWIPGDEVPREEALRLGAIKRVGRPPGSKNRRPSENK